VLFGILLVLGSQHDAPHCQNVHVLLGAPVLSIFPSPVGIFAVLYFELQNTVIHQ
jgi:hypothetical protein